MTTALTHATIDDVLGPAHARYFGSGFRRVNHRLTGIMVDPLAQHDSILAAAAIDYPGDWSTKGIDRPPPHLSTLDALVIAVQVAEAFLTHAHALDPDRRRELWLRAIDMRAGLTAQEDLTAVPVRGGRQSLRPTGPHHAVSYFLLGIGTFKVTCEVAHHLGRRVAHRESWPTIEEVLGDGDRRQYGRAFRRRTIAVSGVAVSGGCGTAAATVRVDDPDGAAPVRREGLGARYEPSLSMIDATAAMAQLAQALTYHLEGVVRPETETLWMRRLALRSSAPAVPLAGPLHASARVVRRRQLDRMGKSWRTYELDGDIADLSGRASMAFNVPQLPDERGLQQ